MIKKFLKWLRPCNHEFNTKDLELTGIPPLERPSNYPYRASYHEWQEYYSNLDKHPSHTKRVVWPCNKCREKFYAHCGLDIAPKNGFIMKTGKALAGIQTS